MMTPLSVAPMPADLDELLGSPQSSSRSGGALLHPYNSIRVGATCTEAPSLLSNIRLSSLLLAEPASDLLTYLSSVGWILTWPESAQYLNVTPAAGNI